MNMQPASRRVFSIHEEKKFDLMHQTTQRGHEQNVRPLREQNRYKERVAIAFERGSLPIGYGAMRTAGYVFEDPMRQYFNRNGPKFEHYFDSQKIGGPIAQNSIVPNPIPVHRPLVHAFE